MWPDSTAKGNDYGGQIVFKALYGREPTVEDLAHMAANQAVTEKYDAATDSRVAQFLPKLFDLFGETEDADGYWFWSDDYASDSGGKITAGYRLALVDGGLTVMCAESLQPDMRLHYAIGQAVWLGLNVSLPGRIIPAHFPL
jgi:hypothetical protein